MGSKITQDEFISKCKKVHGSNYDYSKTIYCGSQKKIIVTCKKHGDFEAFAHHHSQGRGCPQCTYESKRLKLSEFLIRSKAIHGDRYDYSKVSFNKSTDKVTITCREHGDFVQTAHKHISGRGCSVCGYGEGVLWRNNPDGFRVAASKLHLGKYDYSKVEYKRSIDKVEIVCPEHGSFWQSPNTHMQGVGCPVCGGSSKAFAKHNFVSNAVEVHGLRYDYSKTEYVDAKTKVTITCKEHGDFHQIPGSHLIGCGCPSCAKYGFDKNKPAVFYVYKISDFVGYGITNNFANRYKQHKTTFRKSKVGWSLVCTFCGSGEDVLRCEQYIKKNLTKVKCSVKGFVEESTHLDNLQKLIIYLDEHLTTANPCDTSSNPKE